MDENISPEQLEKMVELTKLIVDRICFEVAATVDADERMAQVQRIAATIAQGVFEAEFGSTFSSLVSAGKRETHKRIDNSNKIGWSFVQLAIDIVKRMSAQEILATAERVLAAGKKGE